MELSCISYEGIFSFMQAMCKCEITAFTDLDPSRRLIDHQLTTISLTFKLVTFQFIYLPFYTSYKKVIWNANQEHAI
jgi:hypothetical protein